MVSPAPIVVKDGRKSKLLLGRVAAFGIHTVVVYAAAVQVSPWLVYHWFGWIAPVLQVSISMPATDWYLQHLEIVTVVPAMVLGYLDVTRFFPPTIRNYVGSASRDSVALWAWVVPAVALGYKMSLYHAPSSVLFSSSMSATKYFFDIQKFMPTRTNYFSDPLRVLEQMTITAPFYAGVAYCLGALASKHRLLTEVFTYEKHDGDMTPPES